MDVGRNMDPTPCSLNLVAILRIIPAGAGEADRTEPAVMSERTVATTAARTAPAIPAGHLPNNEAYDGTHNEEKHDLGIDRENRGPTHAPKIYVDLKCEPRWRSR